MPNPSLLASVIHNTSARAGKPHRRGKFEIKKTIPHETRSSASGEAAQVAEAASYFPHLVSGKHRALRDLISSADMPRRRAEFSAVSSARQETL